MGKRQGIRWKTPEKNNKFGDNPARMLTDAMAVVLFDLLCVFLFIHSATGMAQMVYEPLECSKAFSVRVFYVFFMICILMEAAEYLKKLPSVLVQLGVPVLGVWLTGRWLAKGEALEKIISGFWKVTSAYLEKWNVYFDMNLSCPSGKTEDAGYFLEFLLICIGAVLFWLAKLVKRNGLLAILPVFFFAAGLIVGSYPSGKGVLLLFLGILTTCNRSFYLPDFWPSESKSHRGFGYLGKYVWIPVVAAIALITGIVYLIGRKPAQTLVTEYSKEAEKLMMDTVSYVADMEFWTQIEDPGGVEEFVENALKKRDSNHESVDNHTPKFDEVPYLRLTLTLKPEERMYLRGFYAGSYENGTWKKDVTLFEEACRLVGFDPEVVKEELTHLGIRNLKNSAFAVEGTMYYFDAATAKAYLPYFMLGDENEVMPDEEGGFKKYPGEEEIAFTVWRYGVNYPKYLNSFASDDDSKKRSWESWYEEYVMEQYLAVPDNMPNVEKVAQELLAMELSRTEFGEIESENEERLAKAFLVADWMGRNTSYSQVLDKLPWREDPVEYFLGTGRKGYCMHYASASTLILRKMGIPARYASGYVADRTDFVKKAGQYEAEILDNRAHAWVEIYLNGIGWVPVEVTAGYSTLLPTPTPVPTSTPTPKPTPTHTPTPIPTPTNTPAPTVTGTPVPTSTLEETGQPGGLTVTSVPTPMPTETITPAVISGVPTPSITTSAENSGTEREPSERPVPGGTGIPLEEEVTPVPTLEPGIVAKIPTPGPTEIPRNLGEGKRGEPLKWYEMFGMIAGLSLLGFLIYRFAWRPMSTVNKFFQGEKAYHKKLLKEMKRGGNGRAIKMLNRSIYRRLCFNGKLKAGCTDAEYEAFLKENFSVVWPEDWERFMDIVKAAEFSLREFTSEEVEFCYRIYRDIIK